MGGGWGDTRCSVNESKCVEAVEDSAKRIRLKLRPLPLVISFLFLRVFVRLGATNMHCYECGCLMCLIEEEERGELVDDTERSKRKLANYFARNSRGAEREREREGYGDGYYFDEDKHRELVVVSPVYVPVRVGCDYSVSVKWFGRRTDREGERRRERNDVYGEGVEEDNKLPGVTAVHEEAHIHVYICVYMCIDVHVCMHTSWHIFVCVCVPLLGFSPLWRVYVLGKSRDRRFGRRCSSQFGVSKQEMRALLPGMSLKQHRQNRRTHRRSSPTTSAHRKQKKKR